MDTANKKLVINVEKLNVLQPKDNEYVLTPKSKRYVLNRLTGSKQLCVNFDMNKVITYSEDDDDSIADPDYVHNSSSDDDSDVDDETNYVHNGSFGDSSYREDETLINNIVPLESESTDVQSKNSSEEESGSQTETNNLACKNQYFTCSVSPSSTKKKKYFCIYCKQRVTHFPRHLEHCHGNEKEVMKFSALPKGCPERTRMIKIIRNKGSYECNCDANYNKGDMITMRRSRRSKKSDSYLPCANCLGFYAKSSLRKHFKQCSSQAQQGGRRVMMMGKRILGDISHLANETVKTHIFPVIREDEITRPLRYDTLVIIYANKLSMKYRKPHHYPMIRTRIRLIGRILAQMKNFNPNIKEFSEIYHPGNYDKVIESINIVAQLDKEGRTFKAPSTASSAGSLLKKCGHIYITELIKQQNKDRKQEVEDFLKLLEVDYTFSVSKTVTETQLQMKRQKKTILPSMDDIKSLIAYLNENRIRYHNKVSSGIHSVDDYKHLQCFTMISIQVFNRRRAGEIQRIEINDFNSYQTVDENTDPDIFNSLPEELKRATKSYVRFAIRGKLGREVPVLLYKNLVTCIKTIISYREKNGVPQGNPFIFALPGTEDNTHNAGFQMRLYSKQCGAKSPNTLRGTNLRKHVATQAVIYNLSDTEVTDLANFMGHAEKIHKDHYRLPIATRDITRMSVLLEKAQGGILEDISGDEEDLQEIPDDNINKGEENCFASDKWKKRSTSPMGRVSRRSWDNSEIQAVNDFFKKHIEDGTLPSLQECQKALSTNSHLVNKGKCAALYKLPVF